MRITRRAAAAVTTAVLMIGGLALTSPPANAEVGDSSNATGQFVSGTLLGGNLSTVANIAGAQASYVDGTTPGSSDVVTSPLDVQALQALNVNLGSGVSVPLGSLMQFGLVNQYAEADPNGVSRAASGAVANDGAVDVSGSGGFPASATLNLMQLLPATPALSAANLSLGAVTGVAAMDASQPLPLATSCNSLSDPIQCRDYSIASATLNLTSPLVGTVSTTANSALSTLATGVNGLANQITTGLLNGVTSSLSALNGLVPGLSLVSNTLSVSLDTSQIATALAPVLSQTLVAQNSDGTPSGVAIDLATGTVTIDLAKIIDLNNLPPNSTLLSPAVLQNISGQIAQLLGTGPNGLQTQINNAIQSAVNSVGVTIGGGVCLLSVPITGCTAGLNIGYHGTLGALLNGSSPLTVAGTGGLGVLVAPLLNTVTSTIQGAVSNVVQPLATTLVNTAGQTVDAAVTNVTNGLSGALSDIAGVAAVNINVQQQNVDGAGTYTEIAAQVSLLNDAGATLNLGKAVVGPNVAVTYSPTLTASSPAPQGGTTAVGGSGWPPDTDVTLQLTDGAGHPVGNTVTVHTDASGALPAGTTVPIPATAAPGNDTVVGTTAGGLTASAPVTVVDQTPPVVAISTPADGSSTNDTTPTITGTLDDPTATVQVTITDAAGATVFTGPATVDPATGNWTVGSSQLPADGSYTITATATDPAGNHSDATSTFTLDTTPPPVAITGPADGATTNDNTPAITGTTEPDASVDVVVTAADGTTVFSGPATVNADGTWSVGSSHLPDGTYTVTATATDPAGNAAQATSTFTVDTTAPTVTIVNPADGSTSSDNTPTITGTTNDPTATVTVVITDANGATVFTGPATVNANGTWTIDSSQLPDGTYTVTATATDPAGNSASTTSSFTVDTTAPPIAITNPANGSTTTDNTPSITGTTEPGATVDVTVTDANGTTVFTGPARVNPDGTWTANSSQLPDGTYTASATATDPSGNSATTSISFTVDTTAPTVAITGPANGSVINDPTPTITGTTNDPTATVTVVVTDANGTTVFTGPASVNPDGTWTVDSSQLPADGTYTITATATDPAGNTSTKSSTFTLDTTPPPIAITSPANGSTTADNTPTITGTTEPGATVDVVVTDANGAVVFAGLATVAANGDWTIDSSQLPDGTDTVTATATDEVGNTATTTSTFTVDTTAPTVAINGPANGSVINDPTPTITGTTDDPTATVTVVVTDANGKTVFTGPATVNPDGTWTVDSSQLPADGTYTITATATDPAGNTSTDTSTFTLDTTAPMVAITGPADGAIINDTAPTITGTTDDPTASINVVVTDANGTTVFTGPATVNPDGTWTVDSSQLPADGSYTITATATDPAGNHSTDTSTFTLDSTAPPVAITGPANGSVTKDSTPTITGTTEPDATVDVVVTNTATGAQVFAGRATVDPTTGAWTVDSSQLPDGDYTVTATATDPAGNTAQATSTFTIDTTAPAVTITNPANGSTTGNNTPTITGTTEPGATVTVTVTDANGATAFSGSATVDANGNWTIDSSQLPDGTYTVTATATDPAGNKASTTSSFTVDTTAPPIAITNPANGSTTTDNTPTVTGTTEPGATVQVVVKDANGATAFTGAATVDASGNWTVVSQQLPDGTYTAMATATDSVGNTATDTVGFTVDATAPSVAITGPANGSTINDPTPTITGTTDDPTATVTVVVTDANGKTVFNGPATVDPTTGIWTVDSSELPADGSYTITATATDPAGNTSTKSSTFTLDTTPPPVAIIGPPKGSVTNDSTPAITGTTGPGATVDVVVTDANGKVLFSGPATVNANGTWSVGSSPLPDGTDTVTATATDPAGNTAQATSTFTVDATAPKVAITSPADGSTTSDNTPAVKGTVNDPTATVDVTITDANGNVVFSGPATVNADGTWSVNSTTLPDGSYTVTATATDPAGNTSTATADITVESTVAAPVITSPTDGSTTSDETPLIAGTGKPRATVSVYIDGRLAATTTVGPNGHWSVAAANAVGCGQHTVSATQTVGFARTATDSARSGAAADSAGGTSVRSAPVTFTVTCATTPASPSTPTAPSTPTSPAGTTLPNTGAPAWTTPVTLLGLGCLLGGVVMVTRRRRS